ncbi:uncharacterized protein [Ptychodera flava]|uniref:uncharacterized protein n=1 Tax=Ptychodera flava TaxID=63121 RepID=UPI00396A9058
MDDTFHVDSRRCRERTMLLLDYYKKKDLGSLRRSGTEEEYKEKEQLLQEIKELEQDKGVLQVLQNTKTTESDREKASEIRRRAMETLRQSGAENDNSNNNNDDDEMPSRKAKRSRLSSAAASQNVLLFLERET